MRTQSLLSLAILSLAASYAVAQGGILPTRGQVLAATGDPVPGLASGVTYNSPDTPVVDLNGNMLFSASLLGTTSSWDNRVLLYGRTRNDLVVVAQSGGPEPTGTMPGVNLIRYISASTPAANTIAASYRISPTGGILMWGAGLTGTNIINTGTAATGRNDSAYFWGPAGGQVVLVQRGMAAPSGGSLIDTAFSAFSSQPTCLNATGTAVFQVALVGGDVVTTPVSNAAAWLVGTPGNLQWMLRRGDVVNVVGGTATIGTLGFGVQMNESGFVLHDEKLSTAVGTTTGAATVSTTTDGLLMLYTPGFGNTILAREGDAAPNTLGAQFLVINMMTVGITRGGRVGFHATLVGGDVNGTVNNSGIFTGSINGNFSLAVRQGDTLPSGETLATINSNSISINDDGHVVFFAVLTGPGITTANDQVLVGGTPGNLRILAQEGVAAPGVPGFTFGPVQAGSAIQNDRGQVVFNANLDPGSVGSYWGFDPVSGLVALDVSGDVYTTVSGTQTSNGVSGGLQFSSGDGGPMTLNNNGDHVRRISSGNGIGVAVRGMLGGLTAMPASIPATGGVQTWEADAGIANAGRFYVFAGTLSGTRPGFNIVGVQVPLNNDFWLPLSIQAANGPVYSSSWGVLDGNGRASAAFNFPAGFSWLQTAVFHHAFVVVDPISVQGTFVSNPASLRLY
ncbi:MAG: hypothetical protein JNK49_03025 [Planctomycetes bacterium]|nr:hypothetical protein [Planctomycetota bacterium]